MNLQVIAQLLCITLIVFSGPIIIGILSTKKNAL
jgi:hypothetical protein